MDPAPAGRSTDDGCPNRQGAAQSDRGHSQGEYRRGNALRDRGPIRLRDRRVGLPAEDQDHQDRQDRGLDEQNDRPTTIDAAGGSWEALGAEAASVPVQGSLAGGRRAAVCEFGSQRQKPSGRDRHRSEVDGVEFASWERPA